jgi:hypothetical protein
VEARAGVPPPPPRGVAAAQVEPRSVGEVVRRVAVIVALRGEPVRAG